MEAAGQPCAQERSGSDEGGNIRRCMSYFLLVNLTVICLQIHFPDGGKTTIKIAPSSSMNEVLYYVASKRSFDPSEIEFSENQSGKKLAKLSGSIGSNKYKELFVVYKKHLLGKNEKKPPGSPLHQRRSYADSGSARPARASMTDVQLIIALLAGGVPCLDAKIPEPWRLLFRRSGLAQAVDVDIAIRTVVLDVIEINGGPDALLKKSDAELNELFAPVGGLKPQVSLQRQPSDPTGTQRLGASDVSLYVFHAM